LSGDAGIGEQLTGWYAQAGYDVLSRRGSGGQLIPYLRYERLDTQHAVPRGFARNPASDRRILTYGVQYKPIEQVVLKLDFQDERNEASSGLDQLNLGVGYVF
ncbi:MAG TPA: hypothetical protein VGV61_12435, partial [Thermoanaerobaculia bacterium]|nr:hypothetical protein [Thermoanaerobaculia bacterium]